MSLPSFAETDTPSINKSKTRLELLEKLALLQYLLT
jgi:hypothetical protein